MYALLRSGQPRGCGLSVGTSAGGRRRVTHVKALWRGVVWIRDSDQVPVAVMIEVNDVLVHRDGERSGDDLVWAITN